MSANNEQVARIKNDFTVEFVDNKIKAQIEAGSLMQICQEKAKKRILDAGSDEEKSMKAVDDLLACVEGGVAVALEKVNEEIAFQSSVRKEIAAGLENYTCTDDTLNSTNDVETSVWRC